MIRGAKSSLCLQLRRTITLAGLVLGGVSMTVHASEAERIYLNICVVCHGDDGSGNMPGVPDLADSDSLFSDSEEEIMARMKSGIQKPGSIAMPPKGGDPGLTDEQLRSLLRYVRKLVRQQGP